MLSGHSALRSEVVPSPEDDPLQSRPPPSAGDQLELLHNDDSRPPRKRWAWLLRHVFSVDLDSCGRCGGPMRWVEAATARLRSSLPTSRCGCFTASRVLCAVEVELARRWPGSALEEFGLQRSEGIDDSDQNAAVAVEHGGDSRQLSCLAPRSRLRSRASAPVQARRATRRG